MHKDNNSLCFYMEGVCQRSSTEKMCHSLLHVSIGNEGLPAAFYSELLIYAHVFIEIFVLKYIYILNKLIFPIFHICLQSIKILRNTWLSCLSPRPDLSLFALTKDFHPFCKSDMFWLILKSKAGCYPVKMTSVVHWNNEVVGGLLFLQLTAVSPPTMSVSTGGLPEGNGKQTLELPLRWSPLYRRMVSH